MTAFNGNILTYTISTMGFLETFFGGALAASAAGTLFFLSFWWRKKFTEEETSHPLANGDCKRYSSPSSAVPDDTNYIQIIHNIKTHLNEETIKRHTAEDTCKKFQTELESLSQEHIALQDSHEKLLKQYNELSNKLKDLRERHIQCHESLEIDGMSFISLNNTKCSCYSEIDIDIESAYIVRSCERLPYVSDYKSDGSESGHSYDDNEDILEAGDPDFELNENVMHALISRDSVTELLINLAELSEKDDISDLVGLNLEDSKEEDLDEVLSNNSTYSHEEEEEEEAAQTLQDLQRNDDINDKPLADVKSTRAMWETLIREKQESPAHSPGSSYRSQSSSACSSPTRLRAEATTSNLNHIKRKLQLVEKDDEAQKSNLNSNIDKDTLAEKGNKFTELKNHWETSLSGSPCNSDVEEEK